MKRTFKRETWCETCKSNTSLTSYFTTHEVNYVGKRRNNTNNVLFKARCTVCKNAECYEIDRDTWWVLYKGTQTHFQFR